VNVSEFYLGLNYVVTGFMNFDWPDEIKTNCPKPRRDGHLKMSRNIQYANQFGRLFLTLLTTVCLLSKKGR